MYRKKRQHGINIFKNSEKISTFCSQASPAERIAYNLETEQNVTAKIHLNL